MHEVALFFSSLKLPEFTVLQISLFACLKVKEEPAATKASEQASGARLKTNAVSEDSDEEIPENMEDYDTRSEASSSSFDSQSSISSNDEKTKKISAPIGAEKSETSESKETGKGFLYSK